MPSYALHGAAMAFPTRTARLVGRECRSDQVLWCAEARFVTRAEARLVTRAAAACVVLGGKKMRCRPIGAVSGQSLQGPQKANVTATSTRGGGTVLLSVPAPR